MLCVVQQLAMHKFKKVIIILACLIVCFPLFSDTCIVTAFKRIPSSDPSTETPFVNVRIIGPGDNSVSSSVSDYRLDLPETARGNYYHAFSWVLSGNAYREVSISFNFKPMKLSSSEAIPYSVKLNHAYTRIGNTEIPFSIDNNNLGSALIYESKKFYYCDTVFYGNNVLNPYDQQKTVENISASDKSATFKYSLGSSTVVQEYKNGSWTSCAYTDSTCSYWNRMGDVYVCIDIPSKPTAYSTGDYMATVEIIISSGS